MKHWKWSPYSAHKTLSEDESTLEDLWRDYATPENDASTLPESNSSYLKNTLLLNISRLTAESVADKEALPHKVQTPDMSK